VIYIYTVLVPGGVVMLSVCVSVERGNAACGVVGVSVCLSVVDKLHHIPGDLHLHSAGSGGW